MSDFQHYVAEWEPGPFDPDEYEQWARDQAAVEPSIIPEPSIDEPPVDPLLRRNP